MNVLDHVLSDAHEIKRLGRLVAREAAHDEPDAIRRLAAVLALNPETAATSADSLKLSNADRRSARRDRARMACIRLLKRGRARDAHCIGWEPHGCSISSS